MKILVITPGNLPVPPVKGGSVETVIDEIFNRVAKEEAVTIMGCTIDNYPESTLMSKNYTLIQLPYKEQYSYLDRGLSEFIKNNYGLIQIENRPTYVPKVKAAFPDIPIILSLHSLTFMDKLSNPEAESILAKVDGVLTVSHFITQTMKGRFPAYSKLFHTNHLGVDSEKFIPREEKEKKHLRKQWGIKGIKNYPKLLYVGRIVPKKGLHTLIASIALLKSKYPKISLIIVGSSWPGKKKETSYMRKIRYLTRQLKVETHYTGYIPPAKMEQVYHLGDIFVCPTHFQEGLPLVNMEAMASGIPVISANRGGINEVIQNGKTGILVDKYKSPSAYAKAIKLLLTNPNLTEELKKNGREHIIKQFSWDETADSLREYYRNLISGGSLVETEDKEQSAKGEEIK